MVQGSKLNCDTVCEKETDVASSSSLDGRARWETYASKEIEWRPSGTTKRNFALIGFKCAADVAKCGGPDEVRKAVDTATKEGRLDDRQARAIKPHLPCACSHLPCRGPSSRCRERQASEMLRGSGRTQT